MLRSADELLSTDDPAWPALHQMIHAAGPMVRVLDAVVSDGRREIEALQVSARSFLGATAYHVGAILIDSGWLCLLGCGHAERAWSITTATRHLGWGAKQGPPEGLVVAVDVLGGLFAINGGFLVDAPPGNVVYFGPDTLRWEDTGSGHSAWFETILDARHRTAFYADLRWKGWEAEVEALPPNMGLSVYPPLYTRESRPIEATRRAVVPLQELVAAAFETARQLNQ